jgi:hypothetical protein
MIQAVDFEGGGLTRPRDRPAANVLPSWEFRRLQALPGPAPQSLAIAMLDMWKKQGGVSVCVCVGGGGGGGGFWKG